MNERSQHPANPLQAKVPEHLSAGGYATAMLALHTREEFVLDFIATFAVPSRLVARIVLSPSHVKRLATAIRENIEMYEKKFGQLPEPPKSEGVNSVPIQDFYSRLAIQDTQLGGCYANNAVIMHTREEFVLNFLARFQPTSVLTARVLASPSHIRRIVKVLEARLQMYEKTFGKLQDSPPSPEPPESGPRFSLS